MRKPLTTWEIWKTTYEDEGRSDTMCLRDDPSKMVTITENGHEKNVKLIYTFEAPTFNTASAIKNRLLGFGPYYPLDDADVRYFLNTETNEVESEDVES